MQYPDTKILPSGYYHPVGFNMGFVGLAAGSQLIEWASRAIETMLKDGELAALAARAHVAYLPPRQPYILDYLTMTDILDHVIMTDITNVELSK